MKITIIGAGLTGLLAANVLRRYSPRVVELQNSLPHNHSALLRFRSPAVSVATAIPFIKVLVRKGIWDGERVVNEPTVPLANRYSFRVTGAYLPRSVWNLEPEPRWIAPANFPELMAQGINVSLSTPFSFIDHHRGSPHTVAISTLPMPLLMRALQYRPAPAFTYRPIHTLRVKITKPEIDLEQTIYNASEDGEWYRATIQGDELIWEFSEPLTWANDPSTARRAIAQLLKRSFGLSVPVVIPRAAGGFVEAAGTTDVAIGDADISTQEYGKINPIPDAERKAFIRWASEKHNIYSLGRYATWRPILLDDVANDVAVIDRLISSGAAAYDLNLQDSTK